MTVEESSAVENEYILLEAILCLLWQTMAMLEVCSCCQLPLAGKVSWWPGQKAAVGGWNRVGSFLAGNGQEEHGMVDRGVDLVVPVWAKS